MAERRMFSKNFVESDGFASLSNDARLLYFYIGIHADDDGFNGQVQRLARSEGIKAECISELVENGFLYQFDSGVYLLRHWNVNNTIQKDRRRDTIYLTEKSMVSLNKNKVWEMLDTRCIQTVSNTDTQIGQSSVAQKEKNSVAQRSPEESGETPKMNHQQLMVSLMNDGIDMSNANGLISKYGDAFIEAKYVLWTNAGKPGKFDRFILTNGGGN